MSEEVNFDLKTIKSSANKVGNFLKQKKVVNTLIFALFLIILIVSIWIRIQNIPLLVDATTGKTIPLALDPFYFLRISETLLEQGSLPLIDNMRYPSAQVEFIREITPQATVFFYRIITLFDKEISLEFVNVLSPVIFFGMGLILFFFLIFILTRSKSIALLGSLFLAITPPYLYRTLTGFSDHEAIGIFAFFSVLLIYSICMKFLDKENLKKFALQKTILFGLGTGFLSAFTIASWGGIANFIFMIIPLSFIFIWLIKVQNLEKSNEKNLKYFILFYFLWVISSILFTLIYNFNLYSMIQKILFTSSSILTGFVLLFIIIDYLLIKYHSLIKFIKKEKLKKYHILYGILFIFLLGIIFLILSGKIINFISDFYTHLLNPFGGGRTSLTVAENKQPFLNDWIAQTGKMFFWLFLGGLLTLGINISKYIQKKKNKFSFILFWIIMIGSILFSRISPESLFNGVNFISKLFYFGGVILFFAFLIWLYFKDKITIPSNYIILFSWAILMLISAKGAIRLFFVVTPFVCFSSSYFIVNLLQYFKKSKDDLLKMILGILIIISLIIGFISITNFYDSSINQAKYTGPSVGIQWQKAMEWVRNNTLENSIFVHWWDYGYWVQYLGERPTITDGGHAVPYWDHLIGRYLLTTPYPETALSFMKSHNVSYLLIDPTDIGKYGAYSKIGSGPDGTDRYSWLPTMISSADQIQEKSNSIIRIYQGGSSLDQDIIYDQNGTNIFLPKGKAAIGAIIIEISESTEGITFMQPNGIFINNQNQISIPLRYLYFGNQLIDFGSGIESVAYLYPYVYQNDQGTQIDKMGALFYLSPLVEKSLLSKLYLMNDPLDQYKTVKLVHSESDPTIDSLNKQGANLGDFAYINGLRGPIKIWEVNYPENILDKEEFLRTSGEYAEFDVLNFTK